MKTVYSFFAGAVAMLAAVYGSGHQAPLVMFAAGAGAAVAIVAAALSSRRRLRAAAGRLEQLAGILDAGKSRRPGTASTAATMGSAIAGTAEAELTAAVKQLGATKPAAIAAARHAIATRPTAPFVEQLRTAIQFTKEARA